MYSYSSCLPIPAISQIKTTECKYVHIHTIGHKMEKNAFVSLLPPYNEMLLSYFIFNNVIANAF